MAIAINVPTGFLLATWVIFWLWPPHFLRAAVHSRDLVDRYLLLSSVKICVKWPILIDGSQEKDEAARNFQLF